MESYRIAKKKLKSTGVIIKAGVNDNSDGVGSKLVHTATSLGL